VEKRIRSSHVVILSAVSSLLFACVISSPVIFIGAESRNEDPAAEASILAEQHLDRAMEEMKTRGSCSQAGRTISRSDGSGEIFDIDTRVVREPAGEIKRISVCVKWKGPLGGGAVVATGIYAEDALSAGTAMSGGVYPETVREVHRP
jgi:hypothetical protein